MDLTQGTTREKQNRAKKMMLWFGIISLIMSFAGLTSAFIVSSSREDWLSDFVLPSSFIYSTLIIFLSSIFLYAAKQTLKKNQATTTSSLLIGVLVLGIAFIYSQILGFNQIIDAGYNFTGPTSNITMSYVYIIAVVHIVHVLAGIICLIVVIINQLNKKYSPENTLGFDLASTFWHFVDILWLYLFFFLYLFN
ncbi:MAG: cytochrome c oxidase subunit 3 [Flavobacteriaceae bacterium]|jgi:cytochrome c oxidase subunit 3|nr:cytochrome c oxidase subunit 3 [Flavobacteriaceae bacterium]MDA7849500.1 cytochrome c oxidase subunit 3 [Flavobacteriaceae bacterium]MDB0003993.1 cytochrome c oxidase subunit 3 [Flavobacteriaceae bacterium]MDB4178525.1 cytochrome c oxidase subunit 3 [Flavobacteriaceae bacterium]MDG1309939.1 cytochrome c oxidase subunit 3 [Flavobacteriaceae bacterium]|tara:strand:- start:5864 stop:6445 length:582 start_codon:yes stop_codon:yes gene_type:complete